jgi:hypothetical protein
LKSPTHRVFGPKRSRFGTRESAFGLPCRSTAQIKGQITDLLAEIRHQRCLSERSELRVLPVKRLRNSLIHAMSLDVATQPAAAVIREKKVPKKKTRQKVVNNPIWDVAPKGAFYKARRFCSLVTDVVIVGGSPNLAGPLTRMAINIWRMSKRHFDGLCKLVRARIAKSASADKFRKSPETLKRFEALIRNPYVHVRGLRCSRHRTCQHNAEYAAMRLAKSVALVRLSLECKKCTVAVCTARWFTPQRDQQSCKRS